MGTEVIEGQVQSLLKRLDEIAALGDNWDSYGAKRIDPAVIKAAKWYIETHSGKVQPAISVSPTAKGEIQLEWQGSESEVTVSISAVTAVVNLWFSDWPHDHEPVKRTVDVPFLGDDGEIERLITKFLEVMPEGTERYDIPGDHTILAWQCVRVYVTGRNGEPPTISITVDAVFDDECDSNLLVQAVQLSNECIKEGGTCAD